MAKVYRVTWSSEIEASSPEDAALAAYRLQRSQTIGGAVYRVTGEGKTVTVSPRQETPEQLLTERQLEVAQMVAKGATNPEIAEALGCTERTVKAHMSSIFGKLGIVNRTQLAVALAGTGKR